LLWAYSFFTVGMNIDVRELAREPLCFWHPSQPHRHQVRPARPRPIRPSWSAAIETGLLLGPGASPPVGIGLATSLGLIA
jgi:CPA2 family monovalent cation:H+ antiporter-2